MVNAWSLAYDVINGTLDENFPPMTDNTITSLESDEYDPKPKSDKEESDWKDPVITVGSGNTASLGDFVSFDFTDSNNTVTIDTSNHDFGIDLSTIGADTGAINIEDVATVNWDMDPALSYMEPGTVLKTESDDLFASMDGVNIGIDTGSIYADTWPHAESLNIKIPDDDGIPLPQNFLADNDDAAAHHFTAPTPGIQKDCNRKYKEDESIKALQDYISTTYGGHYTSDNNNVQTLDLIESVGDAEAFCRSNAIKYLSRYDKKGQAKRDILKALHYSLLLYHFSGQLNETPTRGYETF